jgi:hypothetical protein
MRRPNVWLAVPTPFVPVIVYVVRPWTVVGVPVINPVVVLKVSPLLSAGEIDQVETEPPVELMV